MQVPRSVKLGGLLALALADVALVVAVMRSPDGLVSDSATTGRTSASTSTTTRTPSPTTTTLTSPVLAMAVVDDRVAYRAAAAGCSVTAPGLEKTTDGGRTWKPVTVPGPRSIVRIEFTTADTGYVVGTGEGCDLKVWRTSSGGTDWTGSSPASDFWSPLPASRTEVNSVGGVRTPCPTGSTVVQVARVTDSNTYVLCSKGELRHTTNAGADWATAATVVGARSVAVDKGTGNRLVLAGTDPKCAGTRIWLVAAGGRSAVTRACVPGGRADAPLALDAGSGSVWLSLGGRTWLATGDLNTWKES
jgi:hypothetical protein